jgi:hypothetical protein
MTNDQHDWQPLSQISNSLRRPRHQLYTALAHDRNLSIENALRSGSIPIRGHSKAALGLEAPERIEALIDAETLIEVTIDEVTLRKKYTLPRIAEAIEPWPTFTPGWSPEQWSEWNKREAELFGKILPIKEREKIFRKRRKRAEQEFGPKPIETSDDVGGHCLTIAKFKRVEADAAGVERFLRESILGPESKLPPGVVVVTNDTPPPDRESGELPRTKPGEAARWLRSKYGEKRPEHTVVRMFSAIKRDPTAPKLGKRSFDDAVRLAWP